ncbi:MAG: hypothetical protein QOD07_250 [Frankiaceae bacterium]|jgi:hypothetical protein|nr:hypothetical protein [Frankiaceae bacterium]
MRTTLRALVVSSVLAVTVSGCNGGSSSSSDGAPSGSYAGHGAYINPIDFTLANRVVSDVHGLVSLNCVVGDRQSTQDSEFHDADNIRVDSSGVFSDDYHYAIGNGTWVLHVNGVVAGNGTATGYLYVHGVGCSTSTNGWAAAVNGATLPAIPSQPPTPSAAACSPQPCQSKDDVTLSVQGATTVTKSDDPGAKGVDVTFSVANNSSGGVEISNTFQNFTLRFGNDVVDHSWAHFTDSSGQEVPCMRSDGVQVLPGQQVQNQHICFLLPHDETGQQMTFVWEYAGPPFVIPLGALK